MSNVSKMDLTIVNQTLVYSRLFNIHKIKLFINIRTKENFFGIFYQSIKCRYITTCKNELFRKDRKSTEKM